MSDKEDILNKRDLIFYMSSGDEVEGSKQDVLDSMDEWAEIKAEEKYNIGISNCIKITEAEYEKMKLSKADSYCATRIKHIIDSLEKLKTTK